MINFIITEKKIIKVTCGITIHTKLKWFGTHTMGKKKKIKNKELKHY